MLCCYLVLSEASPTKKPVKHLRDLEKQPTDKDLHSLSKDIVNDWKSLGRELELDNKEIMKIHKDHINYDDIEEKAVAMLLKWKEKKGDKATFGVLGKALRDNGLVSTAQKHC